MYSPDTLKSISLMAEETVYRLTEADVAIPDTGYNDVDVMPRYVGITPVNR